MCLFLDPLYVLVSWGQPQTLLVEHLFLSPSGEMLSRRGYHSSITTIVSGLSCRR